MPAGCILDVHFKMKYMAKARVNFVVNHIPDH